MELVDFLRARYDEDAARQQDIWGQWHHKDCEAVPQVLYPDRETGACDCGVPARVLAEVDAKRAVLTECMYWYDKVNASATEKYPQPDLGARFEVAMNVVRALAIEWRAHPDFNPAWLSA